MGYGDTDWILLDCDRANEQAVVKLYQRFHDRQGISWLAKQLPACEEGLRFTGLILLEFMFYFAGCLCEEFIEHVEKDLSKFALREDSHLDTKENADKKIIYDSNRKNERNDFFTEVKEHLVQAGDPFLVKAFENYLPFKQKNQNDEQGDKGEIISVSKKKEQLYTR